MLPPSSIATLSKSLTLHRIATLSKSLSLQHLYTHPSLHPSTFGRPVPLWLKLPGSGGRGEGNDRGVSDHLATRRHAPDQKLRRRGGGARACCNAGSWLPGPVLRRVDSTGAGGHAPMPRAAAMRRSACLQLALPVSYARTRAPARHAPAVAWPHWPPPCRAGESIYGRHLPQSRQQAPGPRTGKQEIHGRAYLCGGWRYLLPHPD